MIHVLKIRKEYLFNLIDGRKKSEIRLNDRDYQVGDVLEFDMRDPEHKFAWYKTIEPVFFKVTHVHSGLGLISDYVVLSVSAEEGK